MENADPQAVKRQARWERELERKGLVETEFDPQYEPYMSNGVLPNENYDTDFHRQRDAWDYDWQASGDYIRGKGTGAVIRDIGLPAANLSDEIARFGGSVASHGGGIKGLGATLAGKGNLGGFRDPIYKTASGGVSTVKEAGSRLVKNPTALQKIGAKPVNAGFAALSALNAGAAGISEATGVNYSPFSIFADSNTGSLGWHPENFGKTMYEMDYEYDEEGNQIMGKDGKPLMRTRLDENGNPIPIKNKRATAFGGEAGGAWAKAAGVGEAVWNDLTAGGYDAMRANLGGVADMAEMIGLGGDWSRAVRQNARQYVDNRDGAVDSDPFGVGHYMESLSGKVFDAYNRMRYGDPRQSNANSL
jgi:hypothetical protein